MLNYIVVGARPWNRRGFDEVIASLIGAWHFVGRREEMVPGRAANIAPRYLLFLQWLWKTRDEITDNCECACFHMANMPYGHGIGPIS